MVEFVFNILIYLFNTIIFLFGKVLTFIFSILPNSPFISLNTMVLDVGMSKYLGYLAWLIPVKNLLSILGIWLGCMSLYYVYSIVMRWIKLID